jgi:NTP pyrophosphatase (non-canonical NTP hydrolase)
VSGTVGCGHITAGWCARCAPPLPVPVVQFGSPDDVRDARGWPAGARALTRAAEDALAERARQDAKWGEQNHDPFVYGAILGEEFGEFMQAALKARFESPSAFEGVGYMQDMRREAVQVAAVALAIVEALDRGKWVWGGHALPKEGA